MLIVKQKAEFLWATPNIAETIEAATRTCYKSEDKIKPGSAEKLYNQVVKQSHHDSVSEHAIISLRITTDRATLAQFTRHRLFSYSVESQRYVNYAKEKFGNEIQVIQPFNIPDKTEVFEIWREAMMDAEKSYFALINRKVNPETARMVLPNSTKVEFVVTGNVRVWRNFFSLRMGSHAQADIRDLANKIYQQMLNNNIPSFLFDDIIGGH
jgi:thymidylate synthase (FAD)